MKSRIVWMLAALVAMSLVPLAVQAQERLLFRVNIPFEFIAGGVHMPAGAYLGFHETASIIKFVAVDGRASAWVAVKPSSVVCASTFEGHK